LVFFAFDSKAKAKAKAKEEIEGDKKSYSLLLCT
jgi:hypothetical protein